MRRNARRDEPSKRVGSQRAVRLPLVRVFDRRPGVFERFRASAGRGNAPRDDRLRSRFRRVEPRRRNRALGDQPGSRGAHRRLHLAELHALAVDLHLRVPATDNLHEGWSSTASNQSAHVARSKKTSTGVGANGVPFRGQRGCVGVPQTHERAREPNLREGPVGVASLVEEIARVVAGVFGEEHVAPGQYAADGSSRLHGRHVAKRLVHRALGHAVAVHQPLHRG